MSPPENKNDKLTVNLAHRPSDREEAHSGEEWSQHIWVREDADTRRDIRGARERLGQFSVRFVTEAIYGDDVARQIFGETGGSELVRDIALDSRVWRSLSNDVGGPRSRAVSERLPPEKKTLNETKPVAADCSNQQVELLRALLKTMDPAVVKRALTGD